MLLVLQCCVASAQDSRAQYPAFLKNSYIGFHVGYIDYRFSNSQLENGLHAESVQVPHLGVRAFLFGHDFNPYFSAQFTYMRPVQWVHYQNVEADGGSHSVWMNLAGLTARSRLPVTKTVSLYGEGGLGIITRKGFDIDGAPGLKDANYAAVLWGGGLQYNLSANWNLTAGITSSPAHSSARQPATSFFSGGLNYTMHALADERVERNSSSGFVFVKNIFQIGYTTDAFGYGANDFVSKGAVPVFWAADVQIAHGLSANYQRNVFHTRRVFSLDWGVGLATWRSKANRERFSTASLYPVLRFTVLRATPLDLYLDYSLAGPTFISRTVIDNRQTGREFTFQDFMGVGIFSGRKRNINAEIRIAHYSNGNLFPRNPGVTVPLSFSLGYAY